MPGLIGGAAALGTPGDIGARLPIGDGIVAFPAYIGDCCEGWLLGVDADAPLGLTIFSKCCRLEPTPALLDVTGGCCGAGEDVE